MPDVRKEGAHRRDREQLRVFEAVRIAAKTDIAEFFVIPLFLIREQKDCVNSNAQFTLLSVFLIDETMRYLFIQRNTFQRMQPVVSCLLNCLL